MHLEEETNDLNKSELLSERKSKGRRASATRIENEKSEAPPKSNRQAENISRG